MPLTDDEPPNSLPRGFGMVWLLSRSPVVNECFQLYLSCGSRTRLPGGTRVLMLTGNFLSDGPASIRQTRWRGSADSRLARTHPADPAPTTMKSNGCSVPGNFSSPFAH